MGIEIGRRECEILAKIDCILGNDNISRGKNATVIDGEIGKSREFNKNGRFGCYMKWLL